MKIGYLSQHNPLDRNSFSGTSYYMYSALQSRSDVSLSLVGASYHRKKSLLLYSLRVIRRLLKNGLLNRMIEELELLSYVNAVQVDISEGGDSYDIILAPVGSKILALLSEDLSTPPIVLTTDATPGYLLEEYKWNISEQDFSRESSALKRASLILYSSHFMAQRAKLEYPSLAENPDRVGVIAWGLNLDTVPERIPNKNLEGPLKLVFVGKDWERKGGHVAHMAKNQLIKMGLECELTIIGCHPSEISEDKGTRVIPFLNKNNPYEQEQYFNILSSSHFLILPTQADCTPMVIGEANAFGTPVLVSDVGGIRTLVRDGYNGLLFNVSDDGHEYANKAHELYKDKIRYRTMCQSSRHQYETVMNWTVWSEQLVRACHALPGQGV